MYTFEKTIIVHTTKTNYIDQSGNRKNRNWLYDINPTAVFRFYNYNKRLPKFPRGTVWFCAYILNDRAAAAAPKLLKTFHAV